MVVRTGQASIYIQNSKSKMKTLALLLCLLVIFNDNIVSSSNEEFLLKLQNALVVTNQTIASIHDEWKIDEYPLFLKSCFMHKSSWEIMKFKFMGRIIAAFEAKERKNFVISFLGRFGSPGFAHSYIY